MCSLARLSLCVGTWSVCAALVAACATHPEASAQAPACPIFKREREFRKSHPKLDRRNPSQRLRNLYGKPCSK